MWYLLEGHDIQAVVESATHVGFDYDRKRFSSISTGAKTKEELFEQNGILDKPCVICNHLIKTSYHEPTKSELIKKNMCFYCNFWDERFKLLPKDDVRIVDGAWYTIEPAGTMGFVGFGGARFEFQRIGEETTVVSNNVWFGGDISKHFLDKIPDNAIIIPNKPITHNFK